MAWPSAAPPCQREVENFSDDNYMVQADVTVHDSGSYVWVRYVDANNGYRINLHNPGGGDTIDLHRFQNGQSTLLASPSYTKATPTAVKVKLSGSSIKVSALIPLPMLVTAEPRSPVVRGEARL